MKLLFRQRVFSWFDSYDIYDENGDVVYVVKGQFAWGHCFKIFDREGKELGCIKEVVFSWVPTFEVIINDKVIGQIQKDFALFSRSYQIDYKGWRVEGDFVEWNYEIFDVNDHLIAKISKEFLKFVDTYILDINNPLDAVNVLAFALAMDADKCDRQKRNRD